MSLLPDFAQRKIRTSGATINLRIGGEGPPVLLLHGFPDSSHLWRHQIPALTAAGLRAIAPDLRGFGESDRPEEVEEYAIARSVADLVTLMDGLGIERAHVVGHSSSAAMALQFALDAPGSVLSVTLLETALLAVPSGPYAAEAMGRYRAGARAEALDVWMRGVCGPGYRQVVDRAIPGAFDRALADLDTFFEQELPALRDWTFDAQDASRVEQPALVVLGEDSAQVSPVFAARHELLMAWLPNAEPFVLTGANHLLHAQNPTGMAEALVGFIGRHSAGDRTAS
jgi:3-oxoadipate enol-lactonase